MKKEIIKKGRNITEEVEGTNMIDRVGGLIKTYRKVYF